jgi:hypothetical protein
MSGKNMLKAWHRMIQQNFNAFKPGGADIHKERKYEHMEIQKDFEEIEKKRQLQRLSLIEYKKKLKKQLIEQQLAIATSNDPQLIQQKEKELAEEIKKAEETQKYGEYKTFQDFTQTLEQAKRQISHDPNAKAGLDIATADLQKELSRLSADIEKIRSTKQELEVIEKDIEELEPNYVLVTGLQKKLVLNAITYYEFQSRNMQGVVLHPETMKSMEIVHYHVEHNLPVRRELIYEVVPELFETELGELDQYERERILAKRPRLQNRDDAIIRAVEEPPEDRKKLEDMEEYKKQEVDFMEFVYSKAGEFTNKHLEFFETQIAAGFPSTDAVLEHIEAKPEDQRVGIEKEVYDDLQELRRINNDYADLIKLNQAKVYAKQRELFVPEFVKQNERLHQMWVQRWEELVAHSFDFSESIFLPDNSAEYESKLDNVLKNQAVHDINDLIAQSQEEFKIRAQSNEGPKEIDRNQKNIGLLQKLDVLTGAMNQIPSKRKVKTRNIEHFQSSIGHSENSEESRILIDEYTKVLYLNNKDPARYNIIYWAEHFNIEPAKLRNIFNFVTFGLPDQKNPKDVGRVLRFIYDNSTLTEEQRESIGQVPLNQ